MSCNGAFVFPIPTEEQLSIFYKSSSNSHENRLIDKDKIEQYNQAIKEEIDYPNSTVDAERIVTNIKRIFSSATILDVGSGYGFFSRELIKNNFNVEAIELNEVCRSVFETMNGFKPTCQYFNSEFAEKNRGKYDVVLLSQVLEHLPMHTQPIKNIHTVLKNNGVCVIAVPHFGSYLSKIQGRKDMFIVPPEHINFFTIESLTKAFSLEGFETIKTETVSRYDYNKLKRKFGVMSFIPKLLLQTFFKISDLNKSGMFINAYFRKTQ